MKKAMNNKKTSNKQRETMKVVEKVPTKKELCEEQEQKAPLMLTIDETASMIIPGLSEPPVRTLRATIPENESHIFR